MGSPVGKTRGTVGARELKTRLGGYLREVQRGKVLTITERGFPVARLSPILPSEEGLDAVLDDLAMQGLILKPETTGFEPYVALRVKGAPIHETISDERKDRF
jgi:prevent-host-death family protein